MRLKLTAWPKFADVEGESYVEFTLTYRGRLLSQNADRKQVSANKREIRRALSPKLERLWNTDAQLARSDVTTATFVKGKPLRAQVWVTHFDITVGDVVYRPLIAKDLIAKLDIGWLRLDPEAGIVTTARDGADIDNRLKTLFDALQLPQENQAHEEQAAGERIYCLMENDAMIHELSVHTGPLLDPMPGIENPVELHIHVEVKRRGSSSFDRVAY